KSLDLNQTFLEPVLDFAKMEPTPRQCPLWVKSRHQRMSASCPLYPQKQTLLKVIAMSALCQKRTFDGSSMISIGRTHLPLRNGARWDWLAANEKSQRL